MWFKTKNDLTLGILWHQKNALIANHFRFPLGQVDGTLEGLVNLVQYQFWWAQWKISICLLTGLILFLYER